jgi:PadR family transcriptional regulator, regulatory protein PadR
LTWFLKTATFLNKGSFFDLKMSVNEKFSAIRKGLLEFLVLQIIAAEKVYAADILKQLGETEFATQEGTLYPLLSKMRREGLLNYEWKESEAGPPRKYYQLTALGQQQLGETRAYWEQINGTIKRLGEIKFKREE